MVKLVAFIVMSLYASLSWATPPSEILLSYDKETEILHVEAKHVSTRPERHYLHKFVVSINGQQEQVLYFKRQVDPAKFVTDIPLKAKGGDVIGVDISCIQGGNKKEEIEIPEDPKEEDLKKAETK